MSARRNRSQPDASATLGELRSPDVVMQLERLGCLHQNRISFSRSLVRRIAREGWVIRRRSIDIGPDNTGEALYDVTTPDGVFAFYVFASHLEPGERSDRAIAQRWDFTFALCEGYADEALLDDLRVNVPTQDDGRYVSRVLAISRANKSGRIFDDVVAQLARGARPDPAALIQVGYLLRTTAVFANGMFGLADYERLQHRGPFRQPFAAQMMIVYMIRNFSLDVVEHLAARRSPSTATTLPREARRFLGVGNATGLGMAPFVVSHPRVVGKWIMAREAGLAAARARASATPRQIARFRTLLARAIRHVAEWKTQDERQTARLDTLQAELAALRDFPIAPSSDHPWLALTDHASACGSLETQEFLNSLILELHPELVDALEDDLDADETIEMRPRMSLRALKEMIEERYAWALRIDFDAPGARHYFWYKSTVKAEPRLGVRGEDDGAEKEMPLGVGLSVSRLHRVLSERSEAELSASTASFLLSHPEHRGAVQRVCATADYPYAEVQENLLGAGLLPIDLLRCKLSFFGATKFDPKSDRWVRIALFQGAPLPDDIEHDPENADDWFCPVYAGTDGERLTD